jgi:hypothetical protein
LELIRFEYNFFGFYFIIFIIIFENTNAYIICLGFFNMKYCFRDMWKMPLRLVACAYLGLFLSSGCEDGSGSEKQDTKEDSSSQSSGDLENLSPKSSGLEVKLTSPGAVVGRTIKFGCTVNGAEPGKSYSATFFVDKGGNPFDGYVEFAVPGGTRTGDSSLSFSGAGFLNPNNFPLGTRFLVGASVFGNGRDYNSNVQNCTLITR